MAQRTNRRFLHWLQDEFRSERLLPGLTSGLLMGITEAIIALSLGSLIFSGELAAYLPYGIGMALVTAAVIMIGTSLTSRVASMSSTQEPPTVLLAVIAAALASSLSAAGVCAADRAADAAEAPLEPLSGAGVGACTERSVGTPAGLPTSVPHGAHAAESCVGCTILKQAGECLHAHLDRKTVSAV